MSCAYYLVGKVCESRTEARMDFESLPPELKEKARSCESASELLALVEREGIELTDEQLEAVSGGYVDWSRGFNGVSVD